MDTYNEIETDQDMIELANMIRDICHLQDDDKQDVMAAVKTNRKVCLFYQAPISQTQIIWNISSCISN